MRRTSLVFAAWTLLAADGPPASAAECMCVANGTRYPRGALACLKLPSGPKLARCETVLNNTSWTILHDGCNRMSELRRPLRETPLPKRAASISGRS